MHQRLFAHKTTQKNLINTNGSAPFIIEIPMPSSLRDPKAIFLCSNPFFLIKRESASWEQY